MSKKKSIAVFAIAGIFIVLMAVFGVISFESGLYDYTGYVKTIKLGLDLAGGVSAEFTVVADGDENFDARVTGTRDSLESLLVSKGYSEAQVTYQNGRMRVEVPDVDDPDRVFDLIGRPASLEFRSAADYASGNLLIEGKKHLDSAAVTTDENGGYAVGLKFNKEGTEVFAQVTTEYLNQAIFIFVNGENISGTNGINVQSAIVNGNAIITGDYDYQAANDLATKLEAGTFGVTLEIIESNLISATLGAEAIKTSLIAGAVGVLLVFIFMVLVYRMLGVLADIALSIYILIILWFFAVFPWVQLTLPGIAGILLGIGMAVDANVVIFERIKDEYKNTAKAIPSAIKSGFRRAAAAIIDGNVTTIIGAVVLWLVGTASIQGFGITLFISILVSMFTALLITRLLINCTLPFNSESEKLYGLKKAEVVTDEE
ncbi:MAG: protein translocase subunit SecD [Clostridiaceae bacterium]|nr:protein translocase subunit SecD [Clostridiaceae bacterium]